MNLHTFLRVGDQFVFCFMCKSCVTLSIRANQKFRVSDMDFHHLSNIGLKKANPVILLRMAMHFIFKI